MNREEAKTHRLKAVKNKRKYFPKKVSCLSLDERELLY